MSKKLVTLTLELNFDGDYYGLREVIGAVTSWIDSGFEDRSDLAGWKVTYASALEVLDQ